MKYINNFFNRIPAWLSSKFSIFIYLFLLFYLVIFALLCIVIPSWKDWMPSDNSQLIFGNYTNVISALGASIAAGSGATIHKTARMAHQSHKELLEAIDRLHKRLDEEKQSNLNKREL